MSACIIREMLRNLRFRRNRHAVGRRRHERVGHRAVYRRFLVLRRASAARLHRRASAAARTRETGGVGAKSSDREAIKAYLTAVDISAAIEGVRKEASGFGGSRGEYVSGLALCMQTMWDLAMEILGQGAAVPYERCVVASTGQAPEPSAPDAKRERVKAELLGQSGYTRLKIANDCWRRWINGDSRIVFRWRRSGRSARR